MLFFIHQFILLLNFDYQFHNSYNILLMALNVIRVSIPLVMDFLCSRDGYPFLSCVQDGYPGRSKLT